MAPIWWPTCMRGRIVISTAAWAAVVAGAAAPLVRRRLRLPPAVVLAAAAGAPVALCVAVPRSRLRDVAVVGLQMHAYVAAYEMPNDDPERLRERVRVGYPVAIDRAIGLGDLPGLRLQRLMARPEATGRLDRVLVWCHWVWFAVPHGTTAYVLLRHGDLFERAALQIYAVFDLGVLVYWALPTAPPWYAAEIGALGPRTPALRRMMIEHGQAFWRGAWRPLYDVLGGNPLAAMPSLHFATSVMAAHVLTDVGPVPGALGWCYALTLGFALVYLGEHYVADLLAGLVLAEGVRRGRDRVAPALRVVGRAVQRLQSLAQA
jgi:membrane-associated phospholipid phosphatase